MDSKEGWGEAAKEMIITSMCGGGCGLDFSEVRPRGAPINGQRGECPGPVELMRLINGCAKPIRAGGARRVALMFSLDLHHPDVLEFLDAKLENGELTFANVSVKCHNTKEFIKAVKEDKLYTLHWKGKFKKEVPARLLWEKIVKNAHESAEPGFLNWEFVEKESTVNYITNLVTTNPCGEIALSAYDCCCLGHLVLTRFIENGEMDWHKLGTTINLAVRFLDNVLTVNHYPLPQMKDTSHNLRRIGLGTTALADALVLLGFKYGSEAGNKFVDKLYRFISKAAYEASIRLAIEKGPFPKCNPLEHVETGFVSRMPKKIKALILEHGIRNCAILTQAPTGTVSILSSNVSSGIEPMFAPAYERRFFVGEKRETELVFHPLFEQFMKEGKSVEHFVGYKDLSVTQHMELQKIVQSHVDNAVSKTINIPEEYTTQEMSTAWLEYLPALKGTTFYRENTRGYVDEKGNKLPPPLQPVPLEEAVQRFNEKHNVGTEGAIECPSGVCDLK